MAFSVKVYRFLAKHPCAFVSLAKMPKNGTSYFRQFTVRKVKRGDQGTPNPSHMTFYVKVYRFLANKQCPGTPYFLEQTLRSSIEAPSCTVCVLVFKR
ncbi:MAG: hypothetical protein ABJQ38_18215, partial [Flavobacteriaceae bacterium]